MDDFQKAAQGLSRNPIGIISLFLILIYSIASLLFGTKGQMLTETQRWPFIWFLIMFPVIVFIAFIYIVIRHHEKLYAPSEFRNELLFFRKLSSEEQKTRLDDDITALTVNDTSTNSVNEKLYPLSQDEIRLKVSIAEDLTIRALEQDLGCSISREVGVEVEKGWMNFDGAVKKNNELIAIDVRHYHGKGFPLFQIEYLLESLTKTKFKHFQFVSLIIAIVSENSLNDDQKLTTTLNELISKYNIQTKIMLYKLTDLQEKFGIKSIPI